MKNTRPALAAVIAVSAALLFSGCAAGTSTDSATSSAQSCDSLRSEIRDINNGAQNTLASDLSEKQADAKTYFDGLGDRVDTLDDAWDSNKAVSEALDTLGDKLDAGEDFVASVPTDGTDADADKLATVSSDISDAAAAVNTACAAKK